MNWWILIISGLVRLLKQTATPVGAKRQLVIIPVTPETPVHPFGFSRWFWHLSKAAQRRLESLKAKSGLGLNPGFNGA